MALIAVDSDIHGLRGRARVDRQLARGHGIVVVQRRALTGVGVVDGDLLMAGRVHRDLEAELLGAAVAFGDRRRRDVDHRHVVVEDGPRHPYEVALFPLVAGSEAHTTYGVSFDGQRKLFVRFVAVVIERDDRDGFLLLSLGEGDGAAAVSLEVHTLVGLPFRRKSGADVVADPHVLVLAQSPPEGQGDNRGLAFRNRRIGADIEADAVVGMVADLRAVARRAGQVRVREHDTGGPCQVQQKVLGLGLDQRVFQDAHLDFVRAAVLARPPDLFGERGEVHARGGGVALDVDHHLVFAGTRGHALRCLLRHAEREHDLGIACPA